ncbi:MAG: gliding motility lipoprotein GldD [Bacteroidetes bacterium]|nr:gliding motility lipoprotein GldD [Bacteroidota bacterium]
MKRYKNSLLLLALVAIISSCNQHAVIPKPKAYPRVFYPDRKYKWYEGSCPFAFRIPAYADVVQDSTRGADPCWLNLRFNGFNAKLHLSYKPVKDFKNFKEMAQDAYNFAYKHSTRADDISDHYFAFDNHVIGMLYEIEGNTASSVQFFATDSIKHYLRGALYFNARPNKDSLDPVIKYIRTDIDTLIKSIKWK